MSPLQPSNSPRNPGSPSSEPWHLRVYIAGWTPASIAAVGNVRAIEAEYLPGGSTVEIIDLLQDPEASRRDHVLAVPTVVRVRPDPVRRVVGNLGDLQKALTGLGFRTAP